MAGQFLPELRRRHVFRMAGLFIVGAWCVIQVAELVLQSWGLPPEALRYFWIAAVGLFPPALFFSWRYDLTLEGIVRTPDATGGEDLSLKAVDYGILGSLGVVVAASAALVFTEVQESRVTGPAGPAIETLDVDPLSIAVLPFAARSADPGTAFFADGIHDDLLTTLALVGSLKVISRTSVLTYRDSPKNVRQIAAELGVAHILEGGVQADGEAVRINVQLIDAREDAHRWAESYDRKLSAGNLFAIQSEIVETIAAQFPAALSEDERRRIRSDPTDDIEAFRAYTLGRNAADRSSFEALAEAAGHFQDAVERDPRYAMAHAALAHTLQRMAETGAITVTEMIERGRGHIDRAVELDPESGYAQAVLARYEWDASGEPADERFRHALELDPNSVLATEIYAAYLRRQRRNEEALVLQRKALELDPVSVTLIHEYGRSNVMLGRFDEAMKAFRRIGQINPGNPYAAHGAAMATILGGKLFEACYWSDQAAAIDVDDPENPATSAIVYASAGDLNTAKVRLDEALALGPGEPYPVAAQAYYLTLVGQWESAVSVARAALAKEVEDRWGAHKVLLRTVRDEALRTGQLGEALVWYERFTPGLFEPPDALSPFELGKAADLGHLLLADGQEALGRQLLEATIRSYDQHYTLGSANFPLGIAKAEAQVLLGRHDEGLSTLRDLVEDGWRIRWRWETELNPNLDAVRHHPEYEAILESIRADLSAQAAAFRESSSGQDVMTGRHRTTRTPMADDSH